MSSGKCDALRERSDVVSGIRANATVATFAEAGFSFHKMFSAEVSPLRATFDGNECGREVNTGARSPFEHPMEQ
jgi:hypothetical protein